MKVSYGTALPRSSWFALKVPLAGTKSDLTILQIRENIIVPPFLVLQFRHRLLSRVAQWLLDEVLRRL